MALCILRNTHISTYQGTTDVMKRLLFYSVNVDSVFLKSYLTVTLITKKYSVYYSRRPRFGFSKYFCLYILEHKKNRLNQLLKLFRLIFLIFFDFPTVAPTSPWTWTPTGLFSPFQST